MLFLILSFILLILGAVFSLIVKEEYKLKLCTVFSGIATGFALYPAFFVLFKNTSLNFSFKTSPFFGSINLVLDSLSAIFVIIISIMSFIGLIYANGYLKPYINKKKHFSAHSFFLMLLIASMLGVVTIQNGLFFLIIWELMSLSSFFLVIFDGEKKEVRKAGIKYLVYMHLSVIFIISAIAILTNISGSYNFSDYAEALHINPKNINLVFILAFLGFGIKAGFVPFHNWLPDAHPAAPSHVSGIMSGVMIKTGIYGILRTLLLIGTPSKILSYFVLAIALLTVLYGVLYAITQHDIKRLLAYSSIENIGIIGVGIAIGMLGLSYNLPLVSSFAFAGAIFHVLNHSIFKELLFFAAGNTYLKTHTKNIELLGGLIKSMPKTAILFIIGSVAICGLPMFNGFVSEMFLYIAMIIGVPSSEINLFIVLIVSIASLALAGTMAILCFSKACGIMFLGEPRTDHAKSVEKDVEGIMLFPMALLAFSAFFIGTYPQYFVNIIFAPVSLFIDKVKIQETFGILQTFMETLSWFMFVFLIISLIVFLIRKFLIKKINIHNTWGCGYDKVNSHMQYTPSSYDNLFVSTLKPLFKRVSHIKKPKELFPKEAYFEMEIEDIEEAYIVEPIVKLDEKILAKFERIQNGNMQQYILFGLVFLVIAIIGLIVFGG